MRTWGVTKTVQPRDYQVEAIDRARGLYRNGHKWVILCSGTGSGKTFMGAWIIDSACKLGKRVLFIVDRISLVEQTSMRMHELGIQHGVVHADRSFGLSENFLICSSQTLESRGQMPACDFVVIDECHTIRKKIVDRLKSDSNVKVLGLSATPFKAELATYYTGVVNIRSTNQLIRDKWLVDMRVVIPEQIDMTGAKVNSSGEWGDNVCAERAMRITGDIVKDWQRYTQKMFGGAVKTLVFSATVDHGRELCQEFNSIGYGFEQVSYKDARDPESRRRRIQAFREGKIHGLVSVEALAKGFDVEDVQCIVMARPYRKSLESVVQIIGRGMRKSRGKDFFLLMDHANNYLRHERELEIFLENGVSGLPDPKKAKEKKAKPVENPVSERVCAAPGCHYLMPKGADTCPLCGHKQPPRPSGIVTVEGDMAEVDRAQGLPDNPDQLWGEICHLAIERRGPDRVAALKSARGWFKSLTGKWPEPRGIGLRPARMCSVPVRVEVHKSIQRYKAMCRRKELARARKAA